MHRARRRAADLLRPCALVVLVGSSLSACGGDDGGDTATTEYVPDPSDTADLSRYAFTPTIRITEAGFVPLEAVAVFGQRLEFVNETDRPQTISLLNGALNVDGPREFGPIAPGETLVVPDELGAAISLLYESSDLPGQQGRLQIDPGVDDL